MRCKARRRHDWTQSWIITDKPAAASIAVNGGATPATPLGQGVGHYHLLASQAHSSPSYRPPRNASRPSRCLSPSFLCRHSFNISRHSTYRPTTPPRSVRSIYPVSCHSLPSRSFIPDCTPLTRHSQQGTSDQKSITRTDSSKVQFAFSNNDQEHHRRRPHSREWRPRLLAHAMSDRDRCRPYGSSHGPRPHR